MGLLVGGGWSGGNSLDYARTQAHQSKTAVNAGHYGENEDYFHYKVQKIIAERAYVLIVRRAHATAGAGGPPR